MSVLRRLKPPRFCPADDYGGRYVINPYTRCEHMCVYCYGMRWWKRELKPKCDIEKLSEEVRLKKRVLPVEMALIVDPYTPSERRYGLTRRIINILYPRFPIILVTKSNLILRDVDILRQSNCLVEVTITTLDEGLAGIIEPGAPKPSLRMDTVKELNDQEVKCTVRIDPIIPFLTDNYDDLKKIVFEASRSGVEHITGGVLRSYGRSSILRVIKAAPHVGERLKRLYFEEGVLYGAEYFTPEPVRYRLMKTLRDLCDEVGISFSPCREGTLCRQLANSKCDGIDLLKSW